MINAVQLMDASYTAFFETHPNDNPFDNHHAWASKHPGFSQILLMASNAVLAMARAR